MTDTRKPDPGHGRSDGSPTPESLDPLRLPLYGSRLIEASAGTGKTFTIALLYVRMVLGEFGQDEAKRALTPPEILVATFTEAASQELRDRIRSRLREAADCFLGASEADVDDDPLYDLRGHYPREDWPACARRLELAAEWMDEAAVSTIHSWCQRMLKEHAFDSGNAFGQELATDSSDMLMDVVRDYWRTFVYPLDAEALDAFLDIWSTPEAFKKAINPLLAYADKLSQPEADPKSLIDHSLSEQQALLSDIKAPWPQWLDELTTLITEARKRKEIDGRKLRESSVANWLEALHTWTQDPASIFPDGFTESAFDRFTPEGLNEAWKGEASPLSDHPAIEALKAIRQIHEQLPDPSPAIKQHAVHWIRHRFEHEKQRQAILEFQDLLTRLDEALKGPNGERLAATIREQFPAVLIDEFQDTDPVQYRIFETIYAIPDNRPDTNVLMIGDPKQAIYKFRGADIYTYLRARRATAGRHYTLGTNYRSSDAMVEAVNQCFQRAEQQHARGAFMFKSDHAPDNPLPFFPVQAHKPVQWQIDGDRPAALTFWTLPSNDGKPVTKEAYREQLAASCASEIVRLLNCGHQGRAGLQKDHGFQGVKPADIAVLVNSGAEANAIREALSARQVKSVYLSDQNSVLETPQVFDVLCWLKAGAEPEQARHLKSALATPTLALDYDYLDRLNRDELAWEAEVERFQSYRDIWRNQGVLPMLRRLINDFDVPARLLASDQGERALTDLLHLSELLQQESQSLDGEHALIRRLAEMQSEAGQGRDEQQVRLESDADLVQVVTVHKSKGLQYPLVFLPFAANFRPTKAEDRPITWHDANGELNVDLEADETALVYADRERLGEDIRKLYVALTRAQHATWVGIAPIKSFEQSGLGYLLLGDKALADEPPTPDDLADEVTRLTQDANTAVGQIVAAEPPPEAQGTCYTGGPEPELGDARTMTRSPQDDWWIASYSALKASTQAPDTDPGEAYDAAHETEPEPESAHASILSEETTLTTPHDAMASDLAGLPSGPIVGTFLHGILEWAAQEGFAATVNQPQRLHEIVQRRCDLRGWGDSAAPLEQWLLGYLQTPLPLPARADGEPARVSLHELTVYQPELEFWFESQHVNTRALDRLVQAHTLDGEARPALRVNQINGMLKGYIDLVFEHHGRYYVADYKSNKLPDNDYGETSLRDAVLERRYDLQYVLYTLALHRLLRARLPDYNYDRHVGGAVHLFLRGYQHETTAGVHAEKPPRTLIEALDHLFRGETVCEEAQP